MNNTELVQKHENIKKWAGVAALGVTGLLVAPYILMSIGGLVGLAVAGAIGFVMVQFTPWFALKIANMKYRAIDAEKASHIRKVATAAAENPIETMSSMLIERRRAFDRFKTNVIEATTARDTFKEKLQKFTKQYPHRASEFQVQLERMADMVERKKDALRVAQTSLEDGQLKLDEMKAYWEMSQVMQAANKAAGMDTGDVFEKLKADTACDAVFESMNRAFAQMEVAASLDVNSTSVEAKNVAQLAHAEPVMIDVPIKQMQKTER